MKLGDHLAYHAFPSPRGPEDPPEPREDEDHAPTPEATDYREALRKAARLRLLSSKSEITMKTPQISGSGPWEFTEAQLERLCAKLPLPAWDEREKLDHAISFVSTRQRGVACVLLGLSANTLRRELRAYIKHERESFRFRQFLRDHSGQYDKARGKYILMRNPAESHLAASP